MFYVVPVADENGKLKIRLNQRKLKDESGVFTLWVFLTIRAIRAIRAILYIR